MMKETEKLLNLITFLGILKLITTSGIELSRDVYTIHLLVKYIDRHSWVMWS